MRMCALPIPESFCGVGRSLGGVSSRVPIEWQGIAFCDAAGCALISAAQIASNANRASVRGAELDWPANNFIRPPEVCMSISFAAIDFHMRFRKDNLCAWMETRARSVILGRLVRTKHRVETEN